MVEKTRRQVLSEAAELLADVSRWVRGVPAAIDITGQPVEPCDPEAVAWSIDGALQRTGATGELYLNSEAEILDKLGGNWSNITDWENWPARRHSEVADLFQRVLWSVPRNE